MLGCMKENLQLIATLNQTKHIANITHMYTSTQKDLEKDLEKHLEYSHLTKTTTQNTTQKTTQETSLRDSSRRLIKDITTRHALGTTDWLLDHVHSVTNESPTLINTVLSNHFKITLLGELYDAKCRGKTGGIRRVDRGGVMELLKEAVEETSFLTSVAYPDDFVEVKVIEEDDDEDDIDVFVVPSSFRYIIMEGGEK